MASPSNNPRAMPGPVASLPTPNDSHGVAQKASCHPSQRLQSTTSRYLNGVPRARLLTVDEALQYSPLSSIVPFSSNIIGTPTVNFTSPQPLFPTPQDEHRARQPLELLNQDLSRSHGQASLAQKAFKDLKPYLSSASSAELKFKSPFTINSRTAEHAGKADLGNSIISEGLSPFAKMVLNGTDLSHRYPTPSSSEPPSPPKRAVKAASSPSSLEQPKSLPVLHQEPLKAPTLPPPTLQNRYAFAENAHFSVTGLEPKAIASSSNAPASQTSKVAVIVPPLPAEARPSEYVTITEEASKGDTRSSGQTRDQRALADETSRLLQDLIKDIVEAEEELQSEFADAGSSQATNFFVSISHDHGESRALTQAIQIKLDSSLQKSIQHKRLGDVPLEHLSRLQTLCEHAISSAEMTELGIEASWNDHDFLQWSHRLEAVDLGLRSARTVLRIMTGGREEKVLYSEEILQRILRLTANVLQSCLIPVVEARNAESSSELFQSAQPHRKEISQLLYNVGKLMNLLSELLSKVDMAENIVNAVEFLATNVLFVENSHNEKDSVLGIQKFEVLRRTAMDMITVIFSRYPEQRSSIFDEILTSLQKLPTTRQHARQFKLTAGVNIQLVSALIMRLVQTSAKQIVRGRSKRQNIRHNPTDEDHESDHDEEAGGDAASADSSSEDSDDSPKAHCDHTLRRLSQEATSLSDSAGKSAQYVIRFFVSRAMTAPKTGDQPHRHLLDIFCEDLVAVLGIPEWPAAELLLRALLVHMVEIAEKPKFNAPAKNMALELLGLMGSAISDLVASTRQAARSLESDESDFSGYLRQMLDEYMDGALNSNDLLGWDGPYRAVVEHLQANGVDEAQSRSAQGYYLAQWAKAVASGNLEAGAQTDKIAAHLRRSLSRSDWVAPDSSEATSSSQINLAYTLTVLNMDFCRQFDRVLKILLDSISSEQITVRTRSLKSVTQMLEKDPSLLDRARNVKSLIMKCATDKSSMVRDSALMLIGKCIVLRPSLEQEFCRPLLIATNDAATGVRKRAMRLLKDIYLHNTQRDLKSAISDSLLHRAKDTEKAVADLARQTIEEIWLTPFWGSLEATGADVHKKLAIQRQVALIVKTVQRGETVAFILSSLVKELLAHDTRNAAANFKVCEIMVATAFESMLDTDDNPERPEQRLVLQTLTVFAKANPRLFTSDQLKYLQPYIGSLSNSDDFHLFRSAVVIFRCVLPTISSVQHTLLRDVQSALLQSLSKLGLMELNEVAACLWTINGTLKNPDRLVKLVISVLRNLQTSKNTVFSDPSQKESVNRVKKYIRIAGYMGKHCDLEDHQKAFREAMTWWKGSSVAGLIISCVYPFAGNAQPLALRQDAFNSIGLICQSQPYQFNQESISSAFEKVLTGDEPELQNIVLSGFRDFFAHQERQSEVKCEEPTQETKGLAVGKLGASMTASDSDGASALIAQRFLKSVLHIALASQESSALTATEVIASVNRQGLVHPKESGPALVALETSTNPAIAQIAFQEHRNLHQQHESMFEREYMRAIGEAFNYQKHIVKDPSGYLTSPYSSKLRSMFDIINTSKGKYQKKFLSGFCAKIDFDPSKLNAEGTPPAPLQFARFLIENLAFFEYGRMDELLHAIACMEKIVSNTGSGIAHSINTEIFQVNVNSILETPGEGAPEAKQAAENADANIDYLRLRQLTTGSIILSCLWEVRTFLRRLYGLQASQQRRDSKVKTLAKDHNKATSKVAGITGERLVKTIADKVESLGSHESMLVQCQTFVELLLVDNEVKVASEGEDGVEESGTPSNEDEDMTPVPGSGGSRTLKRKGSASANGTPQKRKRGRPSLKRKKSGIEEDSD